MRLSKSLYTRGIQCVKSLWLKKYRSDVLTVPDEAALAIFETGHRVGELACDLFPNGKQITFDHTAFGKKIKLTKKWIDEGVKNIYEATFDHDGILVMVDILHINDDGSLEIYEVKSSTEVKDIYYHDVSIQYYVLDGLGYHVGRTSIIYINNEYVRGDELEIDKLFTIADVSDKILSLQKDIPEHLQYFKQYLDDKEHEPHIDIGKHCFDPYDCDAIAYCWKHIPEYSIFDISRLKKDKKFDLYANGILAFNQITDMSIFSIAQQIQIESELSQKSIINKEAIQEFLDGLTYPIYYLDFETFQQAIPEWKGVSPYMQIPFQYSLHIEDENGTLEHKEFLAQEGQDPRYDLAKRLVEDIPADVTVLAYNMGFEKGIIRKLADMFDEFSGHLLAIHDNIKDLMLPFQRKDFYTPAMRGSYSIKYVLPALVPEMASAYTQLDGVHNGGDAMRAFAKLSELEDKNEIEKLRNALLKYCELDTLAMVKIMQVLKDTVQ